uniref:Gypsy retrotransposon integrase-like protein 1 n=1 Tax=Sinocyclocheilus rhinocerous TaxID=307959 RepID=A0A673JUV2_9TELE
MKGTHDRAGHQGQFRTLSLVRQRFFWLHLDRDVRGYVRHCQRCVISKTAEPDGRAPLVNIQSNRPLQIVCIDFWSAENSQNKSVDVLVVTDHFTRLAQAFPCKNQTAKEVARVLWDKYFCVYGFPERIHSDQGASFESNLISELLRVSGVKKSHTTPYHPMGNGAVERFNRTLGNMICALPPGEKHDWPRRLQSLTFMYNCTVHETTGFAPFYLMFGRVPRLPVDMMFRSVLSDSTSTNYSKYVSSLSKDLSEAMNIAQKLASKEQQRHAVLYNRKAKGSDIDVSDRVLLANHAERGKKKKIADRWESTVYMVVDKFPSTNTFRIHNTVTGQEKIVHRNLLLLANFLPVTDICYNDSASLSPSSDAEADDPSSIEIPPPHFIQDEITVEVSDDNCSDETINEGSNVDTSKTVLDDPASIVPNPAESVPIMDETDICEHTEATSSGSCVKYCTYRTLEWVSQLPDDSSDRADPGLQSEVSYPVNATNDSDSVDGMAGGSTALPEQSSVTLTLPNQQCDSSGSQSVQERVNDDAPSGFVQVTSRFGRY